MQINQDFFLVSQRNEDVNIIPDKYNSGYKNSANTTKIDKASTINGLDFITNSVNDLVLDLYYRNQNIGDSIVIENVDFSLFKLVVYNTDKVKSPKKIIFKNCNFSRFWNAKEDFLISYVFENCSFNNFKGSNSTFINCYFGGSYFDALNPYQNVSLINCFISDLSYPLDTGIIHSDGVQIYGYQGINAQNINFQNCRFEIPIIPLQNSNSSINSCVSIGLEYSNGYDIKIENTILNGGGFSIGIGAKSPFELSNVLINNVKIGQAHKYGAIYPNTIGRSNTNNLATVNSLYIGSVWKDKNNLIHISVTNDTLEERILLVVTEQGTEYFAIPPCYDATKVSKTGNISYKDYPFDLEIVMLDSPWIVCYDSQIMPENQIRFVNWGKEDVYISSAYDSLSNTPILLSGKCGKNATFVLYQSGLLMLKGNGPTYNYNSINRAPWYKYNNIIKQISIGYGITSLGAQLFLSCSNLAVALLQSNIENISSNTFFKCTKLNTLILSKSIKSIANYSFASTELKDIYYLGTSKDWDQIKIGGNNTPILNAIKHFISID